MLDGNELGIEDSGLARHAGMMLVGDLLMCAQISGAPNRLVERHVHPSLVVSDATSTAMLV
jgi:hypothetical protein